MTPAPDQWRSGAGVRAGPALFGEHTTVGFAAGPMDQKTETPYALSASVTGWK
jgi:hypothetical protein